MSPLATSGPRRSFSSSSNDSVDTDPTIEHQKNIRIIAEVTGRDLLDEHEINEVRDYCRKTNSVLCLQLARQVFKPRPKYNTTFLHHVFELPAFKALNNFSVDQFSVICPRPVCPREGGEWRNHNREFKDRPLSGPPVRRFSGTAELLHPSQRGMAWGPSYFSNGVAMAPYSVTVERKEGEYLLMVHWDSIVFAEVPAFSTILRSTSAGNDTLSCFLCQQDIERSQFNTPCLFHPGYKWNPDHERSDSDSDSDSDSNSDSDDISSEGERDVERGWRHGCCKRMADEMGCVVEVRHMMKEEMVDEYLEDHPSVLEWKARWILPEIQDDEV